MTTPTQPASLLILGCGYLGTKLATLAVSRGWRVGALTRNPHTCQHLSSNGVHLTVEADLHSASWHEKLSASDWSVVVNCVGSGDGTPEGYRSSYVEGMHSILEWHLLSEPMLSFIYTSSASVYGDFEGAWIDESAPTLPASDQGRIILESEQIILSQSETLAHWNILRLGGLYGPERDSFLRARNPNPDAEYDPFLNLIHVADACNAILRIAESPTSVRSRVYNLTDNHPTRRSEIDQWAQSRATRLKPETSRRSFTKRPNRRISASAFMSDTGWAPQHLPPFAQNTQA